MDKFLVIIIGLLFLCLHHVTARCYQLPWTWYLVTSLVQYGYWPVSAMVHGHYSLSHHTYVYTVYRVCHNDCHIVTSPLLVSHPDLALCPGVLLTDDILDCHHPIHHHHHHTPGLGPGQKNLGVSSV